MAFFDNMKSKLSSAAEVTMKKTGEYSEIAKLKLRQNKLNGEIDTLYSEIGKLIYKQYQEKTDETEAVAEKCLSIDEKNAAIAKVLSDIEAIKAAAAADKAERAQAKAAAQEAPAAPKVEKPAEAVSEEAEAAPETDKTEEN